MADSDNIIASDAMIDNTTRLGSTRMETDNLEDLATTMANELSLIQQHDSMVTQYRR